MFSSVQGQCDLGQGQGKVLSETVRPRLSQGLGIKAKDFVTNAKARDRATAICLPGVSRPRPCL